MFVTYNQDWNYKNFIFGKQLLLCQIIIVIHPILSLTPLPRSNILYVGYIHTQSHTLPTLPKQKNTDVQQLFHPRAHLKRRLDVRMHIEL